MTSALFYLMEDVLARRTGELRRLVRELARANGLQVLLEPREGGGMAAWIILPETSG